jgi:hypothetical protein
MDTQIISAIINAAAALSGAVIGGGAVWFAAIHAENNRRKEKSGFCIKAIKEDLKNSIPIYEKIQDHWDNNRLIWFLSINDLRKSRKTYDKYDEHLLLIEDDSLRVRISKYYLKSETLISSLEYRQNRKDLIYKKRNDLIMDFKSKEPLLDENEIIKRTDDQMKNEIMEFNFIDQPLPRLVSQLDWIINEAQNIIDKIERV